MIIRLIRLGQQLGLGLTFFLIEQRLTSVKKKVIPNEKKVIPNEKKVIPNLKKKVMACLNG